MKKRPSLGTFFRLYNFYALFNSEFIQRKTDAAILA